MNNFIINKNTTFFLDNINLSPVNYAMNIILRDMEKIFKLCFKLSNIPDESSIHIRLANENDAIYEQDERYMIQFTKNEEQYKMNIIGSDDLGIVYGLLYFSKEYLGVDPFWFWTDLEPKTKDEIIISTVDYISDIPKVRYRGWFVNDEVCLIGWSDVYPPSEKVWFPVFETILRCGGNMVIPGTDLPKSGIHWDLASDMGLWITHHHAEPLGAEMFLRAYPDEEASYSKNSLLFEKLWRESVLKLKDKKVVWTLGFRGQGDCPFWVQDPSFNTPENRGKLISSVIKKQYDIVNEYIEDASFCTNIYGELAELYKQGFINIPDGVIKIWADNGYGKMVSRRQDNEDYRIPSLPTSNDESPNGLYYHITFHDLQAANHLTMLPLPANFVKEELEKAFEVNADRYLLLNSGNIRMHIYMLGVVSKLWQDGTIDIANYDKQFFSTYFPSAPIQVAECFNEYYSNTIQYGEYEDCKAGDEFYHHPARRIVCEWIKGNNNIPMDYMLWVTGDKPFNEQVKWFENKCKPAIKGWEQLKKKCLNILDQITEHEQQLLKDYLLLQIELNLSGCRGFSYLCDSYFAFETKDYPLAFVYASKAMEEYTVGLKALEEAEHDKWKNFYSADYLTNVRLTIDVLDTLRKYIRVLGDSPDFFSWNKNILTPKTESFIFLENTQRRILPDDEYAQKLMEKISWNETDVC